MTHATTEPSVVGLGAGHRTVAARPPIHYRRAPLHITRKSAAGPLGNSLSMHVMIKCPRCGELVSGGAERCIGCGRLVPDPSRPMERRLRALLIGAFVVGALILLGGLVRDSLLHR